MKLFKWAKDGGPESNVDGFFVIEIKSLFSIVVLKFNRGCREAYHSHAFNAYTWFLKGFMCEQLYNAHLVLYKRSLKPKFTSRECTHRVKAFKDSWAVSIRGPWADTWVEYRDDKKVTLTHGRKELNV